MLIPASNLGRIMGGKASFIVLKKWQSQKGSAIFILTYSQ
jgi:hypothetical protein